VIHAAQVFDLSIRTPSRQIPGAVQPPPFLIKWVGNETLGGQTRPVQITTGQQVSTYA
jgi:hypothetical protein